MNLLEIGEAFSAGKSAIELIKSAAGLLPSRQRDDALEKASQAEGALLAAEARLAKEFGYKLCRCIFPPQIMLEEAEDAVCPHCKKRQSLRQKITQECLQKASEGGPHSWMAR